MSGKKIGRVILMVVFCCFLVSCNNTNFAPGKAYIDPDVGGVAVSS